MRRKGAGRPRLPHGERVQDLPKITLPIRPEMRSLLDALAAVLGSTPYKVIDEALVKLCAGLGPQTRKRVDAALKGKMPSAARTVSIAVSAEHKRAATAFVELLQHPNGEIQEALADLMVKSLRVRRGAADKEWGDQE
jgi:hypothetical protein